MRHYRNVALTGKSTVFTERSRHCSEEMQRQERSRVTSPDPQEVLWNADLIGLSVS